MSLAGTSSRHVVFPLCDVDTEFHKCLANQWPRRVEGNPVNKTSADIEPRLLKTVRSLRICFFIYQPSKTCVVQIWVWSGPTLPLSRYSIPH